MKGHDDKGQMHTIEGVMAALIMLLVLVLVVKSTAITPLSSSTTNKHVQLELMNMGNDLLSSLDYTANPNDISTLKVSVLDWDGDEYIWSGQVYRSTNGTRILDNDLTRDLNFTFTSYGVAYDVEVIYLDGNNTAIEKPMIWNGDASDNSITVTKVIALHNSDVNAYPAFKNTGIPDIDQKTDFYNMVNVRLTLWRM
jgi:hypothetical protein